MDPHDHELVEELAESPETEVLASLQYATLLRAVGDLPANQRICITARFLDDLSIAETAMLMECSEGAVKQLQFRGIRNLAQSLRPRRRLTVPARLSAGAAGSSARHRGGRPRAGRRAR